MSDHYTITASLKALWEKSVKLYNEGNKDCETYFNGEESAFLDSIGHSAREVWDFVDDSIRYGEPDFETFLLLANLRRTYFLDVMNGEKSNVVVDTSDLTPKTEEDRGIVWLPRIIEKARAKLRGEMSDDLMYGCGGDRDFCKKHNLHLADLLTFVMGHFDDDEAIIDYVVNRSKTAAKS